MHIEENLQEYQKAVLEHIKDAKSMSVQQRKGKRANAYKHQNPKSAQKQGRFAPVKVHSTELDPVSAEIEALFLEDISKLDKKNRLIRRGYVAGEANPYSMPEGRTLVRITAKQRVYQVDGKDVLVVDLKHRMTEEEKTVKLEAEAERRKNKIPGGAKGQRPFRVVREVIMEREI